MASFNQALASSAFRKTIGIPLLDQVGTSLVQLMNTCALPQHAQFLGAISAGLFSEYPALVAAFQQK